MVDVRIRARKHPAEISKICWMTDKRRCPIPLSANGSKLMRFEQSVLVLLDDTCVFEL